MKIRELHSRDRDCLRVIELLVGAPVEQYTELYSCRIERRAFYLMPPVDEFSSERLISALSRLAICASRITRADLHKTSDT